MGAINSFDLVYKVLEYVTIANSPNVNLQQLSIDIDIPVELINDGIRSWSGTSVEEFFMYASTYYAKSLVIEEQPNLFTNQSHEREEEIRNNDEKRIVIQAMTGDECSKGSKILTIMYSQHSTMFGNVIIASTGKGICFIAFHDNFENAIKDLKQHFPHANYMMETQPVHIEALSFFDANAVKPSILKLHLKGTEFQIRVWNELLKIPSGELSTYNKIAVKLGNSKAARAVGTAIGDNPVAYIIPCHRVVQSNGTIGGFRWGIPRKIALIALEATQSRFTFGH